MPDTASTSVTAGDLSGSGLLALGLPEPTRVELSARVALLEGRLATLPQIEQAKGALMFGLRAIHRCRVRVAAVPFSARNMKFRVVAAQLADVMSTSPSSAEAISRFNQLLDPVAQQLMVSPSSDGIA